MVRYCSVPGCKSKYNKETPQLRFHKFPKEKSFRKQWCINLKMGKEPSNTMVVCSKHFTTEDYSSWGMRLNCNISSQQRSLKEGVVPTQNLPKTSHEKSPNRKLKNERQERQVRRHHKKSLEKVSTDSSIPTGTDSISTTEPPIQDNNSEDMVSCLTFDSCHNQHFQFETDWNKAKINYETADLIAAEALTILQSGGYQSSRSVPQTEDKAVMWNFMDNHICRLDPQFVLNTDSRVTTLTGLPNKAVFDYLCKRYTSIYKVRCNNGMLNIESKILLAFMKIKLGISYTALATLFRIPRQTTTDIVKTVICRLAPLMKVCIPWISKDIILANLPNCFESYPMTRVVLDCTEFIVERPRCLKCRILTYSHYKKDHTCKVLVGVAPSGIFTFLSKTYGGRASDKFITENCKVLDLCLPYEDHVMVDKGFAIDNLCAERGLTLIRPPFLRQKDQFSKEEGLQSACVSAARVHVERAIARIKIFEIFKRKLPWDMLPYIDSILTICCSSVNLSPPILSDERFFR